MHEFGLVWEENAFLFFFFPILWHYLLFLFLSERSRTLLQMVENEMKRSTCSAVGCIQALANITAVLTKQVAYVPHHVQSLPSSCTLSTWHRVHHPLTLAAPLLDPLLSAPTVILTHSQAAPFPFSSPFPFTLLTCRSDQMFPVTDAHSANSAGVNSLAFWTETSKFKGLAC